MTRSVVVVDAGPLTTVQDPGRAGWAHLGVPRSGWLDRSSAALANRLVGNPLDAAVLETTAGGVSFRVSTAMTVSVTGAQADVTVSRTAVALGEPVTVRQGETVRVGPARTGLRSYVAMAGGIDVPPVLGSRSTDTLSGIGPARLTDGVVLPVGTPVGEPRGVDVSLARATAQPATLTLTLGPRDDWFSAAALATLTRSTYEVSADSNRIGLRLHGPRLERSRTGELPSEGIVLGAVQVPSSGEPLVFLNDHPTTGGYPVVGVVEESDLATCAQLRPGDRVRFRVGHSR